MPSTTPPSRATTTTATLSAASWTSAAPSIGRYALLGLLAVSALLTQPALAAAQPQPQLLSPKDALPAGLAARQDHSDLVIFNYSSNYNYAGCYNDTNMLSGTTGAHALDIVILGTGFLTVPMCLEWCAHNGTALMGRPYKFAGLEYSRECYCGDNLNSLARKLSDDSLCNTPCDGDNITACGGANKLSLYNITASALHSGAVGRIRDNTGHQTGAVLAVAAGLAVLFGAL